MPTRPKNALLAYSHLDGDTLPTLWELERESVLDRLDHCDWNKAAAAKSLGVDRRTMYRKLSEYGITVERVVKGYRREPVKISGKG